MELDENLPDTVLQDEDTQNGQNLLGSQIVHNMFTLDMPQPLVTWTVSETIIMCSYAHIQEVSSGGFRGGKCTPLRRLVIVFLRT